MSRVRACLLVVAGVLGGLSVPAAGKVTVLQGGSSPTAAYAGCRDTWVSDESYERNRDQGAALRLRVGGKRHVLIRFDLSAIGKGEKVHKAVLRIADAGFPRPGRDREYAGVLAAYALTRDWDANANWLEHRRTDYKAADAGDWKTPGGEIDTQTDYGRGAGGLIAEATLAAVAGGHVHELDVTAAVRSWRSGKLANHGLLLKGRGRCELASADWPVPAGRPQLVIDHGRAASGIASPTAAPKEIALDAVSQTPDAHKAAGGYGVVRVGQNPNCHFRGASASAYVKDNVAGFPGTWGWMTQCRVGGVAGDVSGTLLHFDLGGIPKGASIQQARLVCSLVRQTARQVFVYRYGAYQVKLPDAPGWSAEDVTAAERLAGKRWPGGGAAGCTSARPVAVGEVVEKRLEVRGQQRKVPVAIQFDLTGLVRAWLAGKAANCGVMLDNRIEGGAYDIYSARAFRAELRPYLEITLSPAPKAEPKPLKVVPAAPAGDYWAGPMRRVHAKFKGTAGTLAQYGDSITVTMAFLSGYSWSGKIDPKNMTPAVARDAATVEKYANLKLWREWKGGEWGNTGMMMSDWLYRNIDAWQRKMNPETAVIMFGTNDIGRLWPPEYTENMAASLRRMMADGTVPMLTSIPPAHRDGHYEYWLAALSIAHGLKVPLIDYYAEVVRRRPDDWDGRLEKFAEYRKNVYSVPTLVSADGTHPSNPKPWQRDFSDDALNHNGFVLRDYMTIRKYAEIIRKAYQVGKP